MSSFDEEVSIRSEWCASTPSQTLDIAGLRIVHDDERLTSHSTRRGDSDGFYCCDSHSSVKCVAAVCQDPRSH